MSRDSNFTCSAKMLLRYQVVSAVKALLTGGRKRSAAITDVSNLSFPDSDGVEHRFSRRTILRWVDSFDEKGFDGLRDAARQHCESSVVLKPDFLAYLDRQKTTDPAASIPELMRRARLAGVLHPSEAVNRTTVWRALKRMDVSTRRLREAEVKDTRRFAYDQRMQMVLVDFKRFRVGPTRAKRLAIYFLDDATRLGLGVLVGTDGEKAIYCLLGLLEVLRRYGLMVMVYMDHGPAFISDDVKAVLRKLGIFYIHGRSRYPQGHGKIERFNRSVKARLLRTLDRADWVDPDTTALTILLRHDLFEVYNHLPHESLNDETPHQRWNSSSQPLRSVENEEKLTEAFMVAEQRTVSNDHCISYQGQTYEVPTGLARQRITVLRALLDNDALYLDHIGLRIRLHPVDPAFNARDRRVSGGRTDPEPAGSPEKSASALSFDHEYGSILDSTGGFPDGENAEYFTTNHKEEKDGE